MEKPFLSRIRIYPVKSLDPVELTIAEVGFRSLRYDREFAMLIDTGQFLNGKRSGQVNQLKAEYDLPNYTIKLAPREGGVMQEFHLLNQTKALEIYLGSFFQTRVTLVYRTHGELMDIPNASSVTILSESSLSSLQKDMENKTLDDLRLRFRANLELGGIEAFGEEKLFGNPGIGVRFKIGDVEMIGISPRARCNVPPRDPLTGITDKAFVKTMMKSRFESIPLDSLLPKHGNFYHLTVNTYISETEQGKFLRVGDRLEILETVDLSSLSEG